MDGKRRIETTSTMARRSTALTGLLAALLVCATSGRAQSSAPPTALPAIPNTAGASSAPANSASAPRTQTPPSAAQAVAVAGPPATGGAREGIKVHGHWTVDVRNPDGTLDKHVEFENSLIQSLGPNLLVGMLTGEYTPGPWMILIAGTASPCSRTTSCVIVPSASNLASFFGCTTSLVQSPPAPYCYATLAESLTSPGARSTPFTSLTLSGQAYVDTSTSINYVETENAFCTISTQSNVLNPSIDAPASCFTSGGTNGFAIEAFTSDTLTTPIPVTAGQTVSIVVVISFQ